MEFIQSLQAKLQQSGELTLTVRVHPGARKTQIKGVMADGTMKIDIAVVPEEGKANAALVEFLAEEFGVKKSSMEIISGETNRRKIVRMCK